MGQYPWARVLRFEILRVIELYPTRHRCYRVVVLAAMIYEAAHIYLTPEVTKLPSRSYIVGVTTALHLGFTTYLLCAEGTFPDHWRRVRDQVHAKADAGSSYDLPSNFPFIKKLWWMLDLAYTTRMVGWVQEPRDYLSPHPPPFRLTFLWKTSLKFVVNTFLIPDLLTLVLGRTPVFDSRLHNPTDGPETYLAAVPFLRRAPYVLAYGLWSETWTNSFHNLAAVICVGLGRSSPTLWPNIWGHWRDGYTIRKFWGKAWHQRMRPVLTGLGRLVANKFLKFPQGSNLSSYTQLYVAFFLSGCVHAAGDFAYEKRIVYRSLKFFLLQAVGITFEDFVIYLSKSLLIRSGIELNLGEAGEYLVEAVVRGIGYCWVTSWFCLTLPVWVDEASNAGLHANDRGPISRFLVRKWKQWT